MDKGRMEAFSDGVIAIIITIMVLGIAAPEGATLRDLLRLLPAIAAYAVSFVGVGTYWNNHHHLLKLVRHVDGRMLWSNLAFLFVLSFFPLATDWMQKTSFASLPTTCYVVLNMLVSLTYMNLERVIRHALGHGWLHPWARACRVRAGARPARNAPCLGGHGACVCAVDSA